MRIVILSQKSTLYSTQRLVEAAKNRGHEVLVIKPLRCYMNISAHRPEIHYQGRILSNIDAVIPRIGASITFYGTAIVRQFEMAGVFTVNESVAITRARDKLRSLQILSKHGIALPKTGFGHSPSDIKDLIELSGGHPLVIKLLQGTQGMGVVLAETRKAAESVIQAFYGLKANILVQEYVKESRGADIRCFVINGKVVGAMKRQAREDDFRSNLHRGGKSEPVEITKKEAQMAVKAAKALGLNISGVDILRSNNGPVVIEVNASPGLEGIEKTTKLDIAGQIIEFIETHAGLGARPTKGSG